MNIIAKAKPIRIRIVSGGEEHFSLDTLRGNLCVQDIYPLIIDGRLSRWLDQQGQRELAEEIKSRFFISKQQQQELADELLAEDPEFAKEIAEESGEGFKGLLSVFCKDMDEQEYFEVLKVLLAEDVNRFNASDLHELYSKWHDDSLYRGSKNFHILHKYLLTHKDGVHFLIEKHQDDLSSEDWKQVCEILKPYGEEYIYQSCTTNMADFDFR